MFLRPFFVAFFGENAYFSLQPKTPEAMKISFLQLLAMLLLCLGLSTCGPVDPEPEKALPITIIELTVSSPTRTDIIKAEDRDGIGPQNPVVEVIVLKPNTNYTVELTLYDGTQNPKDDITRDFQQQGAYYVICYRSEGKMPPVQVIDQDIDKKPLGLKFSFATGATTGTGDLYTEIRFKPDKRLDNICTNTFGKDLVLDIRFGTIISR
jgi:hypothetical protein